MTLKALATAAAIILSAGASQAHAGVFDFNLNNGQGTTYAFSLNTANEVYGFIGFNYGFVPVTESSADPTNSGPKTTAIENVDTIFGSFISGYDFGFGSSSGSFISDNFLTPTPTETFIPGNYSEATFTTAGEGEFGTPITQTLQILAAPSAIPEPATWALMIMGLGGLGLMLRGRRREAMALA